jgi:hypothetical protein
VIRSFDATIFIPVLLGAILGALITYPFSTDQRVRFAGAGIGTLIGVVVGIACVPKPPDA